MLGRDASSADPHETPVLSNVERGRRNPYVPGRGCGDRADRPSAETDLIENNLSPLKEDVVVEGPSPWAEIVGPCYSVASFARETGMTEEEVRIAAVELRVLVLTTLDGVELLPAFQIRDGKVVPQLRPILETLRGGIEDPWSWAQWLNVETESAGRHIDNLWAGKCELTRLEAGHTAWAWAQ